MIKAQDYLKGSKGRKDFKATEILMLKGKNAKGVENPDDPKRPIRGLVLSRHHVYQVGPNFGKVNRDCAHYLVKAGAAIPKPLASDKALTEDYKTRVASAKKIVATLEAEADAAAAIAGVSKDPQYIADCAKAKADAIKRRDEAGK